MRMRSGMQQAGSAVDPALQERVNRLIRKGVSPASIERQLLRAGWGRHGIRAALDNAARKSRTTRIVSRTLIVGVLLVVAYFTYPLLAGLLGR
ncbi:MAG: hypothetical protein ACLFWB_04600 [Armatimonadota bacterium]